MPVREALADSGPSLNSRSLLGDGWLSKKEVLTQWGEWLSQTWDWDWWVTLTYDPKRHGGPSGSRRVATSTHGTWAYDEKTGERYWASAVGWSLSDRHFNEWLDLSLGMDAQRPERVSSVYWLRGREPNPYRYGTHFHALIGGVPTDISRRHAWAAWFKAHGLARVEPYDPARGAGFYVSKYVVKQLGDLQFSPNAGEHRKGVNGGNGNGEAR